MDSNTLKIMSIESWGNMPKSQEDPETPEEMADRVVEAHNEDPDSHLEPGQSLTSHRASEIIDHRARSIVGDKINALDDAWEGIEEAITTSFTSTTITDSSKEWEIDEFVDHWVYVLLDDPSITFRQITGNTATTLTFVGGDIPDLDEDAPFIITKIKYFGNISFFNNAWGAYNNRTAMLEDENDYLEYSFVGNKLAILMSRSPDVGFVKIYIDNVFKRIIGLNEPVTSRRFIRYTIKFDTIPETPRVLKIEVGPPDNGQVGVELEAIDINGVIDFSSLNLPMYTIEAGAVCNGNGYAVFNISPPTGYYFIGMSGIYNADVWSEQTVRPHVFYKLYENKYRINFLNGDPGTTYRFEFQCLVAKKDWYVQND